jgi:hypothetical protein
MDRPVVPWSLRVVGIVALLWNGLGMFLWAVTTFDPETALVELPSEHSAYVRSLPLWGTIAWGLGVLGGLAGALLLLLRKPLAVKAFGLSLLGAVTNQLVYVTNPAPPGFLSLPLTAFIILFAAFTLWYANRAQRTGTM